MALVFNGRCLARPIGGVERYARLVLQRLAILHPDLRVVVPAHAPEDLGIAKGIAVVRLGRLHGHAWEQLDLPRAVEKGDTLFSPANTGPLRIRSQALVVHDLAFHHHPEWFDARFARWYGFLMPRLVRRVSSVITVSRTMADALIGTYGLPPEKVHVVPPFVDPAQFPPPVPVNVDGPFHLFVGHDDPRKDVRHGLDLLFNAVPDAHAVVVGRQRRSFNTSAPPGDPRVTWLPNASDGELAWLYDHAEALLYPSRYEGFGLPVLEALQRGCPVIARPLPVYREQFGEAVTLCDLTGSSDLAVVLSRLGPRAARPSMQNNATSAFHPARTDAALNAALTTSSPG